MNIFSIFVKQMETLLIVAIVIVGIFSLISSNRRVGEILQERYNEELDEFE